jgi:AAA domain-containing protein/TIR domain-containing protein/adenylate/guanylate cyclase family protein
MAPDSSSQVLEMAHVLFLDIVAYSLLPMGQERQVVRDLQKTVLSAPEFVRAQRKNQLISLPTGDGMALVFFGDLEAPVRCAMELSRTLPSTLPGIGLRMGVHTGPVYRVADINFNSNVAGGGINIAQRVMSCGDAGHILVSGTVADVLREVGNWNATLHDLGEVEVKHGQRIRMSNLYGQGYGNPSPPTCVKKSSTSEAATVSKMATDAPPATAFATSSSAAKRGEVAILYKRNAEPDEKVLRLLEEQLRTIGYPIFVDRHLQVGMEWAREIERRVSNAYAVVILLSAVSVNSEMLAHELQIANTSAQRTGKPLILPVRINFSVPLPSQLAAILDGIQYAQWTGPQDNQSLLTEISESLQNLPKATPRRLEAVTGAVPVDSAFYIMRPTDDEFHRALERKDSIILIKGARQMGKSSLMARGLREARKTGSKVILTDFQKLNTSHLKTVDNLFLALAEWIADQLELDVVPADTWNTHRGPSMNFERFLKREILGKLSQPLVWGMDEVDRLFTCSFGSEVFGLFRSWHNERSLDPSGPWQNLTLAIAYATEAHMFITDMNQSPFNVGTRLVMADFTPLQVEEINKRYGSPLRDASELKQFYDLLGGHPYLTRRGLHEMASSNLRFHDFEVQAGRDEGPFGDHLRRLLVSLAEDVTLSNFARDMLSGKHNAPVEVFYRLRSSGLVSGESAREMTPRCKLYATYLARHLL